MKHTSTERIDYGKTVPYAMRALQPLERLQKAHPLPDAVYAEARELFKEKALANLTSAIELIKLWNGFASAFALSQKGAHQTSVSKPLRKALFFGCSLCGSNPGV